MYNILVTGANGQLGSEIRELEASYSQHHFFYTDVATLDITDKKAIALFIQENKITAIINCAAYTAVDKAESEPKLADKINRLAVQYLAEAAKVYDCKFIHISTDYVFDGTNHKPYTKPTKRVWQYKISRGIGAAKNKPMQFNYYSYVLGLFQLWQQLC